MPLPQAMVLHAVTQMASNGWRALLWRQHIVWKTAAASVVGSLVSVGLWVDLALRARQGDGAAPAGCSPFLVRAIPASVLPRTLGPGQMLGGSMVCMMLMLVTGVTGPLLDTLFLRSPLERKQIVATKAACQLFSHSLKLAYFGALIEQSGSVEPWFAAIAIASSMIGTSAGKLVLEKLTDTSSAPGRTHHHGDRHLLHRLRRGPADRHRLRWRVSIPPGFRELKEATGFAAANGPWFEKIENGRAIRGFLPGPQHANALGIVHGGMLAPSSIRRWGPPCSIPAAPRRHPAPVARLSRPGPHRRLAAGRGRGGGTRRARGPGARPSLWAAPRGADRPGRLRAAEPPPYAQGPALDWATALLGSYDRFERFSPRR